jgi:hypothetical protein
MFKRIGELMGFVADRLSLCLLASAIAMVASGSCDYTAENIMLGLGVAQEFHAAALAAFVGIGAGVAVLVVLLVVRERRQIVREELHRLAELNRRLRNSLQVIVDAEFTVTDEPHRRMIVEAVFAIEATLKQLIPTLEFEKRKRAQPTQTIKN